jgi:hypothetical protein
MKFLVLFSTPTFSFPLSVGWEIRITVSKQPAKANACP